MATFVPVRIGFFVELGRLLRELGLRAVMGSSSLQAYETLVQPPIGRTPVLAPLSIKWMLDVAYRVESLHEQPDSLFVPAWSNRRRGELRLEPFWRGDWSSPSSSQERTSGKPAAAMLPRACRNSQSIIPELTPGRIGLDGPNRMGTPGLHARHLHPEFVTSAETQRARCGEVGIN
jgi:hypothetical protein